MLADAYTTKLMLKLLAAPGSTDSLPLPPSSFAIAIAMLLQQLSIFVVAPEVHLRRCQIAIEAPIFSSAEFWVLLRVHAGIK